MCEQIRVYVGFSKFQEDTHMRTTSQLDIKIMENPKMEAKPKSL